MQYFLACELNRYCILALHGSGIYSHIIMIIAHQLSSFFPEEHGLGAGAPKQGYASYYMTSTYLAITPIFPSTQQLGFI